MTVTALNVPEKKPALKVIPTSSNGKGTVTVVLENVTDRRLEVILTIEEWSRALAKCGDPVGVQEVRSLK